MKIAFLGAGKAALKRSAQLGQHQCIGAYDLIAGSAKQLTDRAGGEVYAGLDELLRSDAEIIVIATTHNCLAPLAVKALQAGKHVLVEKPGAISISEIDRVRDTARDHGRFVKVGFNHRFHPAVLKVQELVRAGAIGELMYLRAQYGHGGRLDMEHEWRMDPARGGGELIDQGVHLLDLSFSIFGPMPLRNSFVTTSYWPVKVDDNALLTLSDGTRWAALQVSCSEWKNGFVFELYGKTGKLRIDGLGGSYGPERLTYYRMLPEMGPPEIETFSFETEDRSWGRDLENLVEAIYGNACLSGELESARYSLEQIRAAYIANGYENMPTAG